MYRHLRQHHGRSLPYKQPQNLQLQCGKLFFQNVFFFKYRLVATSVIAVGHINLLAKT